MPLGVSITYGHSSPLLAELKFIYSEKATFAKSPPQICPKYVVTVKSTVEISQNCVAFSEYMNFTLFAGPGLQEPEVPGGGVPWHSQILTDQLTLSQPEGANYAHHITIGPPPDFQNFLRPSRRYISKGEKKKLLFKLRQQ